MHRKKLVGFTWLVFGILAAAPMALAQHRHFNPECARFGVRCQQLILGYDLQSLFVLPGEVLEFEIYDPNWKTQYQLTGASGKISALAERHWLWEQPARAGVYSGLIAQQPGSETIHLQPLVMVPYARLRQGYIGRYPVGHYPDPQATGLSIPAAPKGFIEVQPDMLDMRVSPHFTLVQFMQRKPAKFPAYLVLDERLLMKLETILAKLNEQGYAYQTLCISSGYRTPWHNQQINGARYSLHMWGQAADICVDQDGDGKMADLNRDGKRDMGDVKIVKAIVESLEQELRHQDKIGGMGLYDDPRHHGLYVHVDVRGESARWEKASHKRLARSKYKEQL